MSDEPNRRVFLKTGAVLTGAALVGGTLDLDSAHAQPPKKRTEIAAVKGSDRFKITQKAVSALGGMKSFLPPKASVGILANAPPWWKNPGSYTHPDVLLATIVMCFEAGAKEVRLLIDPPADFLNRSVQSKKYAKQIAAVKKNSQNYIDKPVPRGKSLKKVKIVKELLDCDAYLNLPIIKNHTGTGMTCNLKNLMGANDNATNQFFHHGSGAADSYDDVAFLSQCIADLGTLRAPALCVVDATEVLSTNGPSGPGTLVKPNKVVAGNDPVAVDAYCATLLGLNPKKIQMIQKAAAHKLGQKDLTKVTVREQKA